MKLSELVRLLDLRPLTPPGDDDPEIAQGYASDLLSDVLAHAPARGILITLQVHLNVIAVASHADLRAVIFTSGRTPEEDVIEKAAAEGVALFTTEADTSTVVGRMYALGIRGKTTE